MVGFLSSTFASILDFGLSSTLEMVDFFSYILAYIQ